jgi:hypothetical protein
MPSDTFPAISLSASPIEASSVFDALAASNLSGGAGTTRGLHRSVSVPMSVLQTTAAEVAAANGNSSIRADKSASAPADMRSAGDANISNTGGPSFEFPLFGSTRQQSSTAALPRTVSAGNIALLRTRASAPASTDLKAPASLHNASFPASTAVANSTAGNTIPALQVTAKPDLQILAAPLQQQQLSVANQQELPAPVVQSSPAALASSQQAPVPAQQQQVSAALQLFPRHVSGASDRSENGRSHSPRRMAVAMRWLGGSNNGAVNNLLDSDGTSNGGAGHNGSGGCLGGRYRGILGVTGETRVRRHISMLSRFLRQF